MRVEWVHPTWRDLVIDRLAAEPALRRRFLSRCGVHGLLLALSIGGGALGERRLPLIASDVDWDTIGDRLYELLPELEPTEVAAVLTAIELAVCELGDQAQAREGTALARVALERSARPWSEERRPIPLELLESWLSLSARLDPPVGPPPLAATWAELLPAQVPALEDRAELQRFIDWLTLCEITSRFPGDALRELDRGMRRQIVCLEFLNRVASDPNLRRDGLVLQALHSLSAHPQLGSHARRLLRWAHEQAGELDEPPAVLSGPPGHWPPPVGDAVDRVLSDL